MAEERKVICGVCQGLGWLQDPVTLKWTVRCDNCNATGFVWIAVML